MFYLGAKWVAGKSYDATSAVVVGTKNVATGVASKVPIPKSVRIPFVKRKDKKEWSQKSHVTCISVKKIIF